MASQERKVGDMTVIEALKSLVDACQGIEDAEIEGARAEAEEVLKGESRAI